MTYAFESANKGTIEVSVVGDYADGCKDIDVSYRDNNKSFTEIDDADEIMQWLIDEGIEFESDRSMAFNRAYIQMILIEQDITESKLLDMAVNWTDEDIALKIASIG